MLPQLVIQHPPAHTPTGEEEVAACLMPPCREGEGVDTLGAMGLHSAPHPKPSQNISPLRGEEFSTHLLTGPAALFEQDHSQPTLGQQCCGRTPSDTPADHRYIPRQHVGLASA